MTTPPQNEPSCECPVAGYCPRYQIEQTEHAHGICTGKGSVGLPCTVEKSQAYRRKWSSMVGRKRIEATLVPVQQSGRVTVVSQAPTGRRSTPPAASTHIHPTCKDGTKPGTYLKELLASLSLYPQEGSCRCSDRVRVMDLWGADECERRREEILVWLRSEASHRGWRDKLKATRLAILQGLILNPLDPCPGLLDEALRRTRAEKST